MNEQQFHAEADKIFLTIEEWLESLDLDLDFETQESILTISFPQGSQLVLSRQPTLKEIWLASKTGAFHFHKTTRGWENKQAQKLSAVMTHILNEQFGLQCQIKEFD